MPPICSAASNAAEIAEIINATHRTKNSPTHNQNEVFFTRSSIAVTIAPSDVNRKTNKFSILQFRIVLA